MARSFPYTHISCPCTSESALPPPGTYSRRASHQVQQQEDVEDEEDQTFDPHDPRANFSLYPYDHLLFCDDCHQIRCPRCWAEEVTNWYCPSCLFEVPSSVVKSDGNRCTRNCYNCPICTSPLSINALDKQLKNNRNPQDIAQPSGPFFLACTYCDWTSLDAGIEFSISNKITEQLVRMRKRKGSSVQHDKSSPFVREESAPAIEDTDVHTETSQSQSADAIFANLTKFYKNQLSESDTSNPNNSFGDSNYSSPNNLARIMQLYGGLSAAALKKSREKPQPMREALSASEGLLLTASDSESADLDRMRQESIGAVATSEQKTSHPWNHDAHFTNELWPVQTLLRTKRSKRCRTCRHILTRLDDRKGSTKYKIRLLAQNHIPRLSFRAFTPGASSSTASVSTAFALTPVALKAAQQGTEYDLHSHKLVQYLLTLTNPLFEPVRVTLATPSTTPGRVQSRVTILCPSFEIGADGDMWDEALGTSQTSSRSRPTTATTSGSTEDRQPEAGKIWEKGRNWTSVVVEVLPGSLVPSSLTLGGVAAVTKRDGDEEQKQDELQDGDEILEIPVFVRVEWEAEVTVEGTGVAASSVGTKAPKESREISFWSVLGAGRIVD